MLRNPLHDFEVPWPDEKRKARRMRYFYPIMGNAIGTALAAAAVYGLAKLVGAL